MPRLLLLLPLLGLLILACAAPSPSPPAVPRLTGETLLAADTVWSGTLIVDGTVRVAKGARLTLEPGCEVRFVRRDADRDGLGDAALVVEGELVALGTPALPIRFTSAEADPRPGDWLEIRADFSRRLHLRWCEISYSAHALHTHFTRGIVEDSHIHHNIDGCRLGETPFVLRHNLIEENVGKGVNFRNASVEVAYNIIRRNRSGIFLFESDRASRIHHNSLYANGDNLRLGDFFQGDLRVADNWWGTDDPEAAAATVYDHKRDPSLGHVTLAPASAFIATAGPRREVRLAPAWAFATAGFVDAGPVAAGERLLIPSWDGTLSAFDARGRRLWTASAGEVIDAPPAVAAGLAVVQSWGREVLALELADGRVRWRQTTAPSPMDDHRQGGPVIFGDQVAVPAWNGTLAVFELASGAPRWSAAVGAPLRAAPAWDGERLYVASGAGVLAAFAADGRELWRATAAGPLLASPLLTASGLVTLARNGTLTAWTAAGERLWERHLEEECFYAAPVAGDGALFVATAAGSLWKLDPATGATLWRRSGHGPFYGTPRLAAGLLWLGDNAGVLRAVEPLTGRTLATFEAGGAIQGTPRVADGQVIFGARDGQVQALAFSVAAPEEGP